MKIGELKIVKCSKPKGYVKLNLYFQSIPDAENYNLNLNKDFLLKKAKLLEMNLSKRIEKRTKQSKLKKRLLTIEGSKYVMWEKIKWKSNTNYAQSQNFQIKCMKL